jgi:hypothetical protein
MLDREGTEAAQLDPVPPGQRGCDLVEDGGDDPLDIATMEMRIESADPNDEFGFGYWISPKDAGIGASGLSMSSCQSQLTASRVSVSDRTILGPRPMPANAATPCRSSLTCYTGLARARVCSFLTVRGDQRQGRREGRRSAWPGSSQAPDKVTLARSDLEGRWRSGRVWSYFSTPGDGEAPRKPVYGFIEASRMTSRESRPSSTARIAHTRQPR